MSLRTPPFAKAYAASHDFIWMRTALLPFAQLSELYDDPSAHHIRSLMVRFPYLCSAIVDASPSLGTQALRILDGDEVDDGARIKILSYLTRMASRATPFGLMATVSDFGAGDRPLRLGPTAGVALRGRPDSMLLNHYCESLASDPRVWSGLRVYRGNGVGRRGSRFVLHANTASDAGARGHLETTTSFVPATISSQPAVVHVLEMTSISQPTALRDIAQSLIETFAATEEQAQRLLQRLLAIGVIVADYRPSPVNDALEQIQLSSVALIGDIRTTLVETRSACEELSGSIGGLQPRAVVRCNDRVAGVLGGTDPVKALHVDALRPVSGQLPVHLVDDIARLGALTLALARRSRQNPWLAYFTKRFEGRTNRVPLLEFVDDDGILDAAETPADASADELERRIAWLASLALADGTLEVDLAHDDVIRLHLETIDVATLPRTYDTVVQILADRFDDVAEGRYRLVASPGALSGSGRLCGRFRYLFAPERVAAHDAMLSDELDDSITAELTFLPADRRYENISIRTTHARYEIPVDVAPSMPADRVIALDDLYVTVTGEELALFCESRGKRVHVFQSHTLNYLLGSPLTRVLSSFVRDSPGIQHLRNARDLPRTARFVYGEATLAPMRWQIPQSQLSTRERTATTIAEWQQRFALPAVLCVVSGDKKLTVDVSKPLGIELLYAHSRGEGGALLLEEQFGSQMGWLGTGAESGFVHEIVVSVSRPSSLRPSETSAQAAPVPHVTRWAHAEPWLFWQIGSGELDGEAVVVALRTGAIERLLQSGDVDRWFFVGYNGPNGKHVRLRVRAARSESRPRAFMQIDAAVRELQEEGEVRWWSIGQYQPELERYGLEALDVVEQLFHEDSEAAVRDFVERHGIEERVLAVARFACALLDGWPPEERAGMVQIVSAQRAVPQQLRPALKHAVASGLGRLEQRVPVLVELLKAIARGRPVTLIINDLIHMACNRRGFTRVDEAACRAFTRSYFHSAAARADQRVRPARTL